MAQQSRVDLVVASLVRLEFRIEADLAVALGTAAAGKPSAAPHATGGASPDGLTHAHGSNGAGAAAEAGTGASSREARADALARARHKLRELRALVDELGAGLPDSGGASDAGEDALLARQREAYAQHRVVHGHLLAQLRKASLSMQQQRSEEYRSQRTRLLQGGQSTINHSRQRHTSTKALLQTAKGVTSSLQRSRRVIANTAARMQDAATVLDQGSQKLDSTFTASKVYGGAVRQSKQLLRRLEARNRTDQILNAFGMALFLGVAAYIVYKRTVGQFF